MTDCEIRDLTDQVVSNTAKIQGLQADLRNKVFYFWMLMVFSVFMVGAFWAAVYERNDYKDGAIQRGYMIHNPTNGVLQWVEPAKEQ